MRKLTQAETTAVSGGFCAPKPWPAPIREPRSIIPDVVKYRFVDRNNPLRPPAEPVVPSAQRRLQRFI